MVINANVAQPSPGRLSRLIEWSRGAAQNTSAAAKAKVAELAARTYSAGSSAFASIKASASETYQKHPTATAAGAIALGAGTGYFAGWVPALYTLGLAGTATAYRQVPQDIKDYAIDAARTKFPKATVSFMGAAAAGVGTLWSFGALPAVIASVGATTMVGAAVYKSPFSDESARMLLTGAAELPVSPNLDWDSVLENISEQASRGEDGADAVGAKPGPIDLSAQIEEVQLSPPVFPNKITEALDPQSRAARTDWDAKQKAKLLPLCNQFASLNTLIVMKNWAGHQGLTQSQILIIAGEIQSGKEQRSIWQIFKDECKDLTLFQKLKAGIAYLLFYQTGLMHRIMFTLVNQHFTSLTKGIHAPDDAARVELFHKFLTHGNELLDGEEKAVNAYIAGVRDPHLKDHDLQSQRRWIIENRYGFDLTQLCKDTSKRILEKSPPKVPFFTSLHQIPILGSLSTALENALNSLIRSKMEDAILPQILEVGAKKSAELTEPYQLKFAAKATEMMTAMFEELRKEIPNLGKGFNSLAVSPIDQQQVRVFAKQLIKILSLKGKGTVDELRAALSDQSAQKPQGIIAGQTDEALEHIFEVAIFEGVNKLFGFFDNMSKSKELSARLLDLSEELFKPDDMDPVKLKKRYDDAQSRLNDVSTDLIDRLVQQSFKRLTEPSVDENPNIPVEQLFKRTKEITATTLGALKAVTDRLPEKVRDKINTQDDLATLFKILREFSISPRMRSEIQHLQKEHKDPLWSAFTPLYKRIEEISEAALRLQGAQGKFTTHTEVAGALDRIREILKEVDENVTPSFLSIEELSTYRELIERSVPNNRAEGETVEKVNSLVQTVQEKGASIKTEERLANACKRLIDKDNRNQSLLVQWREFQSRGIIRNLGQPFRHEQFRKEVRDAIQYFPEKTRIQLNELLGNNGSKLACNWDQAVQIIETLHAETFEKLTAHKEELRQQILSGAAWIDSASPQYKEQAAANYQAMERESASISEGIGQLSDQILTVNLPLNNGKSGADRAKERIIRIGLQSFPSIGDTIKEHVAKRLRELSVKARLLPDSYLALGATTRLYSELGK